jgi:AraC-like DNA-binding protein
MRHQALFQPRGYSAGQKSQPPGYSFKSNDYDLFQVICLLRGRLIYESKGRKTTMSPGMLALLRLGSSFSLSTGRVGYQGVCFIVRGVDRPSFRGAAEVLVADPETLAVARMMDQEIARPGLGSGELLEGLGRTLAWRAIRLSGAGCDGESSRSWAETARAVLDATLTTGRAAREILSTLGISYRQLSRHFQDQYGVSPKRYQLGARIEEARRLLAANSQQITSIAFDLGYSSSQHFATQFKAETGITPSAWRRKNGEE